MVWNMWTRRTNYDCNIASHTGYEIVSGGDQYSSRYLKADSVIHMYRIECSSSFMI